ncbi:MAG TPA: histidine kinase, partial [Chitinophagales bacterium]|nr:histidine kinase [Chitinophagales bacterium]
ANTHSFILRPTKNTYVLDVLSDVRSTSLVRDKQGKIWIGMLNGLFTYNNKLMRFGKNKLLDASHVTDMLVDEYNNTWVATHQYGIFIIKSDTILRINAVNGLPEDACIRFFKEADGKIWVCTNRHISLISYSQHKGLHYTVTNEGGLYNINTTINDVYVDSSVIWVAASNGLIRLNRNKKGASSPSIYITAFITRDSTYNAPSNVPLRYFQNNIQVNYVGIAYNDNGCNNYKYILNNSDTVYTQNTSISFSSMAAGRYTFKVWAQNSLGLWSKAPAEVVFEIYPPFWKTWWFNSIALFILGFALWAFIRWRIRSIKLQEIEKTELNKKMAEAQLQALRAQINEHFIFNSLNAIQSFINQNELKAANQFLANFGKLIRRTLDISFSQVITLQEEIDYLENYLLLEKIRYEGRFYYKITNEVTSIPPHHVILPSMILQPYVENAIRHGLRHKTNGTGVLTVSFYKEEDEVVCCIADNGIGRKKAKELKQKLQVEYQSRGMDLSAGRIALFNATQADKISVTVDDGADGVGTVVKVKVPLKFSV